MTNKKPRIFLSFYCDGPFWSDLLHLLAYPSNINYIWPFRYPSNYIDSSLKSIASDKQQSKSLVGKTIVVGTRYQGNGSNNKFLPIRCAVIRKVEYVAGVYQFHFVLGPHFDFRNKEDLSQLTIDVGVPNEFLAFQDETETRLPDLCTLGMEGDNWNAFSILIANEETLPVSSNAANALWINVAPGSNGAKFGIQKKSDAILCWRRKTAHRSLYMYPGDELRISYAHHVPSLEGKNTTLGEISICVDIDADSFEISTVGGRPIGNYGVQEFAVAAIRPTKIAHKLSFKFSSDILTSQDGTHSVHTTVYEMPVFIRWSFLHWLKSAALPVIGLFVSLLVLGVSGIVEKNVGKILDGSLKWSDLTDNWPLILIVAVASACATIAIPFFKGGNK